MRAWLIDTYRAGGRVVLWLKTPEENIRLERDFPACIYMDFSRDALLFLRKNRIPFAVMKKRNYFHKLVTVIALRIWETEGFESFVRWIERGTRHRINLYNADIPPEQMLLFANDLRPFSLIETEPLREISRDNPPVLSEAHLSVCGGREVRKLVLDKDVFDGDEPVLLKRFAEAFRRKDPDVILMESAFSRLPFLAHRMEHHGIQCDFSRWDPFPIRHKGGKSFFSYGRVIYRDYAVRLHGRFLVDTSTTVGSECHVDSIVELSMLSGIRFQQVASRSFGSVFQSSLVRELVKKDYLVPFKEKPVDNPLSLFYMMKGDRVGHTFDSATGCHEDVAEIDFSSMYPWIIYNHNISAETMLSGDGPYEQVPGLPMRISLERKGIVPIAIHPLLERRMEYKKKPSAINKAKAVGLKWVLVTAYGYLRFREFKLGLSTSHMAIGAYAREILVSAARMAEERGFEVIHGIIDSLYIRKKGITEKEVKELCREIELFSGIPLGFEGIFRWIVFLPSVNDSARPVPTRYYGVFSNGDVKARGIEVRQRGVPLIVKLFQERCLSFLAGFSAAQMHSVIPGLAGLLRRTIREIGNTDVSLLVCSVTVSRSSYSHNIPQKRITEILAEKGIAVLPGHRIRYVFGISGVVLPEDFSAPDTARYRKMLIRALYALVQVFGYSRQDVEMMADEERQTVIAEFAAGIRSYPPVSASPLLS